MFATTRCVNRYWRYIFEFICVCRHIILKIKFLQTPITILKKNVCLSYFMACGLHEISETNSCDSHVLRGQMGIFLKNVSILSTYLFLLHNQILIILFGFEMKKL